ncbi:hypothetical protein OA098_01490 [Prochlorococcus sp. AH-736-B04]|nr:hypothetical protein [Prochlorococcus sp. AH-736-B04]
MDFLVVEKKLFSQVTYISKDKIDSIINTDFKSTNTYSELSENDTYSNTIECNDTVIFIKGINKSINQKQINKLDNSFSAFDGYVINGGKLFHALENPPSFKELNEIIENKKHSTGIWCGISIVKSKSKFDLKISIDDLYQYPLFLLKYQNKIIAVSNNPYILNKISEYIDDEIIGLSDNLLKTLNLTYLTDIDRQGKDERNIQPLSFGYNLVFDIENNTINSNYEFDDDDFKDKSYLKDEYEESLNILEKDIKANFKAISNFLLKNSEIHSVVDLSGGIDSRIVLGCFNSIKSELFYDFKFHNVNNSTKSSADRRVANSLAKIYDLKTTFAFTRNRGSTSTHNSDLEYSLFDMVALGTRKYFGLVPFAFSCYGDKIINNYAKITGFYGEYTRGPGPNVYKEIKNASNLQKIKTANEFAEIWTNHTTQEGKNNAAYYLNKSSIELVRSTFFNYFLNELEKGVAPKMLASKLYLSSRSKLHFGVRSAVGNKCMILLSPLLTRNVFKSINKLNWAGIFGNQVGHDLLMRFGGEKLVYHPFADFRWSSNIISMQLQEYLNTNPVWKNSDEKLKDDKFPSPKKINKSSKNNILQKKFNIITEINKPIEYIKLFYEDHNEKDKVWLTINRDKISQLIQRNSDINQNIDNLNLTRLVSVLFSHDNLNSIPIELNGFLK